MTLFAFTKLQEAGGEIALAAVLGLTGFYLLLPRPRGRYVSGGIGALIASLAVFAAWVYRSFGNPVSDVIGTALFWLFSGAALVFGAVLVTQRNPARGAIAFAFVILSTCGLFLLLAAPFLMAATIIIYAGAIIVTFLFVLMLSQADGPSNENDRSREPLTGAFAGFAFIGLVLFTLHQTSPASAQAADASNAKERRGLAQVLTPVERQQLASVIPKLDEAAEELDGDMSTHISRNHRIRAFREKYNQVEQSLVSVVGASNRDATAPNGAESLGSLRARLEKSPGAADGAGGEAYRVDQQARAALKQAAAVRDLTYLTPKKIEGYFDSDQPDVNTAKTAVRELRDEVVILHGMGQLPARNVATIGYVLFTEHLLAIELVGTLLLTATIGAVAISHRKGVAA